MATYWENSCSFGLRYVSWYKCLIVSLVFSHLGFWSGNLFLIAPFPDLCLLVHFEYVTTYVANSKFPSKSQWKSLVYKKVSQFYEDEWPQRLQNDSDFNRFKLRNVHHLEITVKKVDSVGSFPCE